MRVRKNTPGTPLPTDRAERLLGLAWFGMVHRNSLDSHRARCMDSLNVLRELQELFHKPFADNRDLQRVAEEAIEILKGDPIMDASFNRHQSRIVPLLEGLL